MELLTKAMYKKGAMELTCCPQERNVTWSRVMGVPSQNEKSNFKSNFGSFSL